MILRRYWMLLGLIWLTPSLMGAGTNCIKPPKPSDKATYAQNAQQLYKYASKLLKGGSHEDARKAFQQLKTKYPFSRFATLADVGIADTYFHSGQYLQAIDAYTMFVKINPTHPKAGYASYQAALSHDKRQATDWFLVPPAHEKDSTTTKQAIQSYREYLRDYPNHEKIKEARKHLERSLKQMAQHEMYVARYYKKYGKHLAVIWRMDYLLQKYPDIGFDAEARYLRAEAFFNLKQYDDVLLAVNELLKQHPDSTYAKYGKDLLNRLPKTDKTTKTDTPPQTRLPASQPSSAPAPDQTK